MKPISIQDVRRFVKDNNGKKLQTVRGHKFTVEPSPNPEGCMRAVYGRRKCYAGPSQQRLGVYLERFNSLGPDELAKLGNYPEKFGSERSYVVPLLVAVRDEQKGKDRPTRHNWYELAFRTWPILVQAAQDRQPVKYGAIGRRLGIHHRNVRHALGKIHDYCLAENLPPLTILVENWKGEVGKGFYAWDLDEADAGRAEVYAYRWAETPNPFSFAADGATPETIARDIVSRRVTAKDAYARVKVRGIAQQVFRAAVLRAYSGRCAISGDCGEPLLQAAHIVEWRQSRREQRVDPRNGILLSPLYHRMFDLGWITIDEHYRVQIDYAKFKRYRLSPEQRDALGAIDGEKMRLPRDREFWPDQVLLAKRRGRFDERSPTRESALSTPRVNSRRGDR